MDLFQSEAFSSRVRALMGEHHIPGIAIAVVREDTTASKAFGYVCPGQLVPVTADTLFGIASCSKSITAAAVGLLVEDDKYPEVQYDAIVSSLLPGDFVMASAEYTKGITVDDILGNRTGMPGHCYAFMGKKARQPDDTLSVVKKLQYLPVAAPLRSKYIFNDTMYTVLAHLIEVKTQKSFSDFLEERLFEPLGMHSTSLQPARAQKKGHGDRMTKGYSYDEQLSTHFEYDCPNSVRTQGAACIVTSANDCIKWVKALMYHKGPISEKVYQGLVRQRTIMNPAGRKLEPFTSPKIYAAGLEVYYYRGHMVVEHIEAYIGFSSRFFFLPQFKFGACIMGNSDAADIVGGMLARELIDAALGVPEIERVPSVKGNPAPRLESKSQEQSGKPSGGGSKQINPQKHNKPKPKPKPNAENADASQTVPLDAYKGRYWHPGYSNLWVKIKDGRLFIDATDRSRDLTLRLQHLSNQTKYIAWMHGRGLDERGSADHEGFTYYCQTIRAEFVFENGRAVMMGLDLELDMDGLIWFEYQNDKLRSSIWYSTYV
ncbi:beta-lactamase family protein [Hypoxylon cercidicola]|nr:beta-lactamase family protein [Hypoxylon cercidicola]